MTILVIFTLITTNLENFRRTINSNEIIYLRYSLATCTNGSQWRNLKKQQSIMKPRRIEIKKGKQQNLGLM